MSLVDMSPSTLTQLKDWSEAALRPTLSSAGEAAASVQTKASIVAMLGSIMPAPLAMPAMVTVFPSQTKRAVTDLGRVSEVRIALAERTPSAASRERRAAEALMPSATLAIGSSSPIRPVEQTRNASSGAPTAAAASFAIAAASASP